MNDQQYAVICFGEVLWDILPSGKEPGGAPVNVAYHLNRHGIKCAPVTAIGNDADGREIKDLFGSRGIPTGFFAVDDLHETGKVYATILPGNEMSYDIVYPSAWDFIPYNSTLKMRADEAIYFVYGSLASRSEVSRNTLLQLLETPALKVFDINLRPPNYSKELVTTLLQKADILKMNEHELAILGHWFSTESNREKLVADLSALLGIETIIVTLGGEGAILFRHNHLYYHPGFKVTVADTIGSGDAFLAGMLYSFVSGKTNQEALDYACRLGAFVAGHKGGCPPYELQHIFS